MVSLKKEPKEPKIREFTPVHLMDEEETIQRSRELTPALPIDEGEAVQKTTEKQRKKPRKNTRTLGGLDVLEWIEIILKSIFIMGILAVIVYLLSGFLEEGLQLAKKLRAETEEKSKTQTESVQSVSYSNSIMER